MQESFGAHETECDLRAVTLPESIGATADRLRRHCKKEAKG